MPEAYVFSEGSVSIWTGSAAPGTSAVVGYAQNTQVTMARGWVQHESIDGVYADHLTGQRADVTIAAIYTYDNAIARMIESATAVNMKFQHNTVNGSAGWFLYSGRVDVLAYAGYDGAPFVYTLTYHANSWSGYGG